MTRFSVLIPVYNGADFIGEALKSIAEQSLNEVQVVVSNNASTDDTLSVVKEWQEHLNIKVIHQPKLLSMQDHFNAILDTVDTEFYMLLCHDDYLADVNALLMAQTILKGNPEATAVYCDLLYVNAHRRTLGKRVFRRGNEFFANDAGVKTIQTARNQFGIPIGVRRSHLGKLRYDPCFHYAMDVDLSWAISRDKLVLHIPRTLIANRYSNSNMTWRLLSNAKLEFICLAQKYNTRMNRIDRTRLTLMCFFVSQQKYLFSLYGKFVTWAA